jgi:membrane protease YdiL (CAAX protease family)
VIQTLFRRIRAAEDDPPWGLLTALAAVVLMFLFFAFAGSAIAVALFGDDPNTAIVTGWLIGGLLTLAFVWFGQRGRLGGLRMESGLPFLIAFGFGLGIAITLDLLAILFTGRVIEPPETARLIGGASAFLWAVTGLFVVLIQPAAEEVVFRGMLYPALRAAQNVWAAILVSGIMYGLFHQILYTYSTPDVAFAWWYTLVEPIVVGISLSLLRAATQSTGAAIAAHVGVGVFALLKTLLITGFVA